MLFKVMFGNFPERRYLLTDRIGQSLNTVKIYSIFFILWEEEIAKLLRVFLKKQKVLEEH
jgi:hypothetical protein